MSWGPAWQLIFFGLGSLGLGIISRRPLRQPGSHGFYRFFAWEVLWGMFLLQVSGWFREPLSWHQLISWALLVVSTLLVVEGVRLLRVIGRQEAERKEAALLEFEKTSRLVTTGLYGYIRHPLYSSLLFLGWGIFFKAPSGWQLGLALVCTVFLVATAKAEEQENIAYFGLEYRQYMHKTRMFIPFIL